ncbi:MAG: fused MFS/spermidine synthase [Desulfobacterales bacterium]|nr:fused MFS/spermidine synthase [Desulfobacterales bacterium]
MDIQPQSHPASLQPGSLLLNAFVLSCFFLSGAAGLIYQVLWIRMIDKVIGSAPFAVASVLAVFMGGLALGSFLAGKTIDRNPSKKRMLCLYGAVEIAIGVYGLIVPFLITQAKPVYTWIYNLFFQYFWAYQFFTLAGCTLLLLIPTALMGITLPILCRFYVMQLDHLAGRTGSLYALNTVGAAIGALLCGFILIKSLGLWGTLGIAVFINFSVGLSCILLGRKLPPLGFEFSDHGSGDKIPGPDNDLKPAGTGTDPSVIWALGIFLVSGFSSMAYEVIWTKLLSLLIGPTTYSFTIIVAAFITGLAVGSFIFGWIGDRVKGVLSLLAATQIGAALLALLISQFFGNGQFFFAKLIYIFQNQYGKMLLVQFLLIFSFLLAPTMLLGATFSLVNRIYARSLPVIGRSIGTAYAVNTVGAILGSIAAGFILVPFLGKENSLRLVIALQLCVAFSALAFQGLRTKQPARHRAYLAVAGIISLVLVVNFPSWNRQLLANGQYRDLKEADRYLAEISWFDALYRGAQLLARYKGLPEVVFYADGTGGFTTVTRWLGALGTVQYALLNSGKADASSHSDRATQTLLAHVPLLFHPRPDKVMVLGLASGMTAGEVLRYPVKQLDVLEINDQVVKASGFFSPWNNAFSRDPRTRIIVQDGRNHLALTREKYDVIISEPSNPWMAGLANLFSREFFQTVKSRLNETGIFVQWIQAYEMDWPTFAMIGRTFAEIFPEGLLITTTPEEEVDYLLVGFSGEKMLDLETARKNMKYARQSRNISIEDPRLILHFIITEDLKRLFGQGPVHTDNWPRLEFAAPKYLYDDDFPIQNQLHKGQRLSPETQKIIDADNPMDVFLDLFAFSVSTFSDLPALKAPELASATPVQKERYRSLVRDYCSNNPVTGYDMFPTPEIQQECAELQMITIRRVSLGTPAKTP